MGAEFSRTFVRDHAGWLMTAITAALTLTSDHAWASRPAPHRTSDLQLRSGTIAIRPSHGHDPSFRRPDAAWNRLRQSVGGGWSRWNALTGVVSYVIPRAVSVPGAVHEPGVAASFATDFLNEHLAVLAPGASPHDFVLVADDLSAGVRTIGFEQHHRGRPVLGGQVSFRFKADRLTLVASQAFPDVRVADDGDAASPRIDAATRWLRDDGSRQVRSRAAQDETSILPVVLGRGRIEYHEVTRALIDVEAPVGRWEVFFDRASGAPIARRQKLAFGSAHILYNVPERSPAFGERYDAPAAFTAALHGDAVVHADASGLLEFDEDTMSFVLSPAGERAEVTDADGSRATFDVSAVDGDSVVWDARDDERVDAQLAAYVHALRVKSHALELAPDLEWLANPLPVNVNIDDACNAFSDGNSINFFLSSQHCENSARIADVVYHEFGHSLHWNALIAGVGSFDYALSEGASDYLAATLTGDPAMGRGFFYDDKPLRHLDPEGREYRWPQDRGEVHAEGRIIAGALWDLRERMIEVLGEDAGIRYTDTLWYETLRRAVDIPSMYTEALVHDDDDGDLSNGTPNGCLINEVYGAHGLFSAGPGAELVLVDRMDEGDRVELQLDIPSFPDCPVEANPELVWRSRDQPKVGGTVPMIAEGGTWSALLPSQPPGNVVQFQINVGYSVDPQRQLPLNSADPYFELYVGDVEPLYCTGFESDTDWNLGKGWTIATPDASASPYDPDHTHEGAQVLQMLGTYAADDETIARSPRIDTRGYRHVRLQYWRWLTVEDGFYDSATITANDQRVWRNAASSEEYSATIHHIDHQWRFHDVDISDQIVDGAVEVAFGLRSDAGLHFGGWTIDGLCVVGVDAAASGTCGDGDLDPDERCDDGNTEPGDGCDASCELEQETDTAGLDDATDRGCACSASSPSRGTSILWWLAPLAIVRHRRRRRRS